MKAALASLALASLALAAAALAAATPAMAIEAQPPVPAPAAAPQLSLIGAVLHVTDVERELAFYRDGLGMTLAMTLPGSHGTEYMLRFGGDPAAPGIILQHDPAKAALTHGDAFSRLVLRVSDLDALAARLEAAGYAHAAIKDVAHGYRMMMLSDPQGFSLELVQSAQQR